MRHDARVGGRVGEVQVIGRLHQAAVEIMRPHTVHKSAGEVGIFLGPQPGHQRRARVGIFHIHGIAAEHFGGDHPGVEVRVALLDLLDLRRGVFAVLVGANIHLLPRHRLTVCHALLHHRPQGAVQVLGLILGIVVGHLAQLIGEIAIVVALVLREGLTAHCDALEEGFERVEIGLSPLIKGMLVTLGALNAHAEEAVGKGHRFLLGLTNVAPGPEPRHVLALGEILGIVLPMILRHFLSVIDVGLIRVGPTRGQHDAPHNLVVRFVVQYTLVHPIVPVAAEIHVTRQVLARADLLRAVALKIIELGGPPSSVGRAPEEFVHLFLALLRVLAGEKIFHFLSGRQCTGHIQSHPT